MVVVATQYVAAILFYMRNRKCFLTNGRNNHKFNSETQLSYTPLEVDDTEAVLLLSSVKELKELRSTIRKVIHLILPAVTNCVIYLQEENSGDLISEDGLVHCLPKTGIIRDSINGQQVNYTLRDIDVSDPVSGLLHGATQPTETSEKVVLLYPILAENLDIIVAFLILVCDPLNVNQDRNLRFITKQIAVCCSCLRNTSQNIIAAAEMGTSRTEAILELCGNLHDQDAASLQLKVIKYLQEQTLAETAFLLLVAPSSGEIFCQVIGKTVLPEEIRFPAYKNCFSIALHNKKPLTLSDIPQECFSDLHRLVGEDINSLLCVPVTRQGSGEVVALACMINKHANNNGFGTDDIETIQHCFKYTATVLTSTLAFQNERKLKNQTEALLQVAKNLFTHLDDLTNLLREIMQEARNLTKAERCSVFLVDEETDELVAKVFDGSITDDSHDTDIRIPINQGVAGHVVSTGEILNIHDAYSDPLFYRGVDDATGFKTRNILCFPIKDEKEVIVGVAQLCNKIDGHHFTSFDEDIARAFSIYCCISIVHSLVYRKLKEAQFRGRLATELMIYHMQVNPEDVYSLSKCQIPTPTSFNPNMDHLLFPPRCITDSDTPLAMISMMDDMGFLNKYRIRRDTLARFLLMVRKGYRDPPYHNWMHAFSVAHFCYLLVQNLQLNNYLNDLEVFALFIACMCHDIDHRGTNNTFQVTSKSVLAALYSSEGSVMERHHFAQTMCILNTEGCNIFENLKRKEYERVLDLMRDVILATDIAHHLRILKDIKTMAKSGYKKEEKKCHKLLLSLLMTACDLCDQTKPWKNAKKIAELIYSEFFSQGDLEKALGRKPIEMMDREKACIPILQMDFLDHIALPVYQVLAELFPKATVVCETVENNRTKWVEVNEKVNQRKLSVSTSIDVFSLLSQESQEEQNGS